MRAGGAEGGADVSVASCIINRRLPRQIRYHSPRRCHGKHDHPSSPNTSPPTRPPAHPPSIHSLIHMPCLLHLSTCLPTLDYSPIKPSLPSPLSPIICLQSPPGPTPALAQSHTLASPTHEFRLDRPPPDGSEAWKMH